MTDPCQNLQSSLSGILQDLLSMSASVIKRSTRYLTNVNSLDPSSVESVSSNVHSLMEKMNTNLQAFMTTYDTAVTTYKEALKNGDSKNCDTPKKKLSLSLKRNADSDIEFTTSDEETTPKKQSSQSSAIKNETLVPKDEDDVSDTDSQKTIMNFDVPVTNDAIQGLLDGESDDLNTMLDELNKNDENQDPKTTARAKSMSFDFDDDDVELLTAAENVEKTEKETENQTTNHSLLDLLNKALPESPEEMTEADGDEAVKILEDEISYSTETESDDSLSLSESSDNDSSDDWKPSHQSRYEFDSVSDTETSEEEPEVQLKELVINMKTKLDHMSDSEIDRLCNLENINKRKCLRALDNLRKKRRKRIRLLSSSSSSSLSSDIPTPISNSPTPDLEADDPLPQDAAPNIEDLADQIADNLAKEDEVEISSDSEDEPEPEKKKKTKKESNKEPDVEKDPKPEKKIGSWRNEIFFGTSSESEDDPDVVLNDPLVEKVDEDEDSKEKTQLKIANDGDDETMVITDSAESNSDSDDDVTFVSEGPNESPGQRGRRNIRAIITDNELNALTQRAKNEEDERIQRLEEHTKTIESIQSQRELSQFEVSQREEFVLDMDVTTGTPLITVDYNLAKMLKPHQKEGVTFMWEACYESVAMLKKKPGTGCILAHCMGLGKTLQVITLIHTLFKHSVTNTKHVLVICPLSTVTNWKNEFKKSLKNVGTQVQTSLITRRYFIMKGDVTGKIRTIKSWRESGGVLVMGYETFQILTNKKLSTRVSAQGIKTAYEGLVNPGPDLIVCDEGHQLKNDKTLRSKALVQVKTKRRIVLTGTPLQNNLKEYYWMVNFVKPHLLGTDKEYLNRFATPITNGQYYDSRPEDIKLMKKRTHVLNKLLKKTIHRVESGVLASYLPEIIDYTIFVKLGPVQMELYQKYIYLVKTSAKELRTGYLADVMMLNINNLHPYALQLHYNRTKSKKKKKQRTEDGFSEDDEHESANERVARDWFKSSIPEDVARNVDHSPKLRLILNIVDEATLQGDKVLIFCQRRAELDLIEHFLKTCGTSICPSWRPNFDYYRMDGETCIDNRDTLCTNFNANALAKVFLLTHRVGGLGLNLIGANRVIMIGSNHNPSLDAQSMYRVYRFGQSKKCFIYRLLSLATMEEKIYHRCVVKLHLSGTVVDKLHFTRKITSTDLQEMYNVDFRLYTAERPIPTVPTDKLLAQLLRNTLDIYKYHPHNSLLENRPEDELTDEDKTLAWEEFNNMEEAAKLEARNLLNNQVTRPPVYPVNLAIPLGRANTSMVPNPMNNNVRGFIPKNLWTNGTPITTPQNLFTVFKNNPRPFPRPPNTTIRLVGNPAAVANNNQMWRPNSSIHYPTSETLQNLRENVKKVIREQPRHNEASPSGEFNYSLNKIL